MKFVYTGPSWAANSYPVGPESTNLAQQWQIPHFDCALSASNVLQCIEAVKRHPSMPIVWIYHEPLGCLTEATGLSLEQFLTAPNWQALREDCNQFCLEKISGLGRPVLLLGGPSDIVNCDRPNITVGASSWQKFLAQQANMPVNQGSVFVKMQDGGDFFFNLCWGAEVIHRTMHQHPNIEPTVTLVNAVWDVFFFWKELEKANLFCDVHPNIRANQEFAKKVFPEIENFLADAK